VNWSFLEKIIDGWEGQKLHDSLYDKDSDEFPVWELLISSIYIFNHFTESSLRA